MNTIELTILRTLAYGDVFDFPLSEKEVYAWLLSNVSAKGGSAFGRKCQILDIKQGLHVLLKKGKIGFSDGYYHLSPRAKQINRAQRRRTSQKKRLIAQNIAGKLRAIPTISLIGISGTIAMYNADESDDIDFYLICKKGTVWTTRFFTVLLVDLFATRRKPGDKNWKDKICLNMFVDEDHVAVLESDQNLFTAHEVLQMYPLFGRSGAYKAFLSENRWVEKYLKNKWEEKSQKFKVKSQKYKTENNDFFFTFIAKYLEPVLKRFQIWYMKDRKTSEVISDCVIRLHPHDAKDHVLRAYKKRLQQIQIPPPLYTDNYYRFLTTALSLLKIALCNMDC